MNFLAIENLKNHFNSIFSNFVSYFLLNFASKKTPRSPQRQKKALCWVGGGATNNKFERKKECLVVILLQGSDSHEPVEILNDMAFRIRIVWLLEGPITNQSRFLMTWQLESRSCPYWRGKFTNQSTSWMTWRLDNWDPVIEGSNYEPVEIRKGVAARIEMLWSLEGSNHKPVEILNDVAARIEMLGAYSRGQITNRSRSWMMWQLESRCCDYLRGQIMNQSRSWMMWWLESRCCDYSRGEFTSQSISCMEAARNRDPEWRGG